MKKCCLILISIGFVLFAAPETHAYLTKAWERECGKLEYRSQTWFINGFRLYSRSNWEDLPQYINKKVCAEGYVERSGTTGKKVGISFHSILPENQVHSALPESSDNTRKVLRHVTRIIGVLTTDLHEKRTLLMLPNGNQLELLDMSWQPQYLDLGVYVDGDLISEGGRITGIAHATFLTPREMRELYPATK